MIAAEKIVPLLPRRPVNMGARWYAVEDSYLRQVAEHGLPTASAAAFLKRTPEECRARLKELAVEQRGLRRLLLR